MAANAPLAKSPKCSESNDMAVDTMASASAAAERSSGIVARFQSNLAAVAATAPSLSSTSGGEAFGQGGPAWSASTSQDYSGAQQLHFYRIEIGAIGIQAPEAE